MTNRLSLLVVWSVWALCLFTGVEMRGQSWNPEDYAGARLGVVFLRDVRMEDDRISFTCDLANTGRETLYLTGPSALMREVPVVLTLEQSSDIPDIEAWKETLARALLTSGLKMVPGEYLTGQRFKGTRTPPIPSSSGQPSRTELIENIPEMTGPDEGCPDLVIDSVWVMNDRKYTLRVGVRLRNTGDAPAFLYKTEGGEEGMGIAFFLGNTPSIARSSRFVHGEILRSGLEADNGALLPGASFDWELKILLSQRPGYLTNLQCQLDNFQFVTECDRTNNTYVFPLGNEQDGDQ
ncbi:MAG: hypothetical protein J5I41_04435 [Saprospiraceae bacterium]|nr:hypothetical protein [Saprospiraceae bacterium]